MLKKTPLAATLATVLASGLMLGATNVAAHEEGAMILRLGAATVAPNEDSDTLAVDGALLGSTKAEVDRSDTQLGITFTYMFSDNLGIGVLAATPFEHDLEADLNSIGASDVDAGSIKHLPPTVTLQYFPLDNNSAFQPYIGVGINYTTFFQEDVDSELEGAVGGLVGDTVSGDLELDDSWGWAADAGFDYLLNDHWTLSAQVWYLDIDTEAEFTFTGPVSGTTRIEADVDIDPWVYMVSVGYKF